MKRFLVALATALLLFLFAVPAASAATDLPHTGRVLVSVGGDISLPASERADVLVVVRGTATVYGDVNTIVVVDGQLDLLGATTESIVAVRSSVSVGQGSVVLGDVRLLDATLVTSSGASIAGRTVDLGSELIGLGVIFAPAVLLLYLGFAVAMLLAALLLVAVGTPQVRATEGLISREPGTTLLAGIAGVILPPLIALMAAITVIGAPAGIGLLLFVWPAAAFVGYLVAGIWVGDWILRHLEPQRVRARPYAAAVIGTLVLMLMGIVPPLVVIASLFGFGGVILSAWRSFRGSASPSQPAPQPIAWPAPG